jgi:hypothetical protein
MRLSGQDQFHGENLSVFVVPTVGHEPLDTDQMENFLGMGAIDGHMYLLSSSWP